MLRSQFQQQSTSCINTQNKCNLMRKERCLHRDISDQRFPSSKLVVELVCCESREPTLSPVVRLRAPSTQPRKAPQRCCTLASQALRGANIWRTLPPPHNNRYPSTTSILPANRLSLSHPTHAVPSDAGALSTQIISFPMPSKNFEVGSIEVRRQAQPIRLFC